MKTNKFAMKKKRKREENTRTSSLSVRQCTSTIHRSETKTARHASVNGVDPNTGLNLTVKEYSVSGEQCCNRNGTAALTRSAMVATRVPSPSRSPFDSRSQSH